MPACANARFHREERLAPILTKEAATDPALFHAFLRDIGYLLFGLIATFARKGNYDSVSNQSALDSKAVPITMIQEDGFLMNARGTSVMMRPASPTRQGSLSCSRNCLAARIATLIPTLSCPQITQSLLEGFEAIEINDVFLKREEFSLEAAIQACASQRPRALIQMIRRN